MTSNEKLTHKKKVHAHCVQMLAMRINVCRQAIENAQQASNEEEKSSAGDKFETSRAMNHLDKEMYGKQLQANLAEQAALQYISPDAIHDSVKPGSYITCKDFDFFLAGGLGKTELEGRTIYLLSPDAPVAGLLRDKIKGDVFIFNKGEVKIVEVY